MLMPRASKKRPGLHLDHEAIIQSRPVAAPGTYIPTCSTRRSWFLRAPDVFRHMFHLVVGRAPAWSASHSHTSNLPFSTCESRGLLKSLQITSRRGVFPFSTFGNCASTLDPCRALRLRLSGVTNRRWRLAKMPDRSGAEPRARRKLRLKSVARRSGVRAVRKSRVSPRIPRELTAQPIGLPPAMKCVSYSSFTP